MKNKKYGHAPLMTFMINSNKLFRIGDCYIIRCGEYCKWVGNLIDKGQNEAVSRRQTHGVSSLSRSFWCDAYFWSSLLFQLGALFQTDCHIPFLNLNNDFQRHCANFCHWHCLYSILRLTRLLNHFIGIHVTLCVNTLKSIYIIKGLSWLTNIAKFKHDRNLKKCLRKQFGITSIHFFNLFKILKI